MDKEFVVTVSIILTLIALNNSVDPMISSDFPTNTLVPWVPPERRLPDMNAFVMSSREPYSKEIPPPNMSAELS